MSKKYKYKIGDWVEFKKYIKVNSMDDERFLCDPVKLTQALHVLNAIPKLKNKYLKEN